MPGQLWGMVVGCSLCPPRPGCGRGHVLPYALQAQEPGLRRTLAQLQSVGLEFATLILAFTLAVFVVLVFGVRLLMVLRKRPVPLDPLDMAKPRVFRTLMLLFAVLLAPLVALDFLPAEAMDRGWTLAVAYATALVVAALAWLLLELFYQRRGRPPR